MTFWLFGPHIAACSYIYICFLMQKLTFMSLIYSLYSSPCLTFLPTALHDLLTKNVIENINQISTTLMMSSEVRCFTIMWLCVPAHFKEEAIGPGHPLQLMFMFLQEINVTFFWDKLQQLQRHKNNIYPKCPHSYIPLTTGIITRAVSR